MATKKSEQTPISAEVKSNWGEMMQKAKPKPELYPRVNFNGPDGKNKLFEGIYDLQIVDEEPRAVEYDDPFGDGDTKGIAYVFNVRILNSPLDPKDSMRALFMPSDPGHGLTSGVLNLSKNHGGKLRNVSLRIETKNYQNKKYKTMTRGYTVSEIPGPSASAP